MNHYIHGLWVSCSTKAQYGTDWGKVLAFVSLTLAPAVIFYLMAQKHIIAGLTSGAVKG